MNDLVQFTFVCLCVPEKYLYLPRKGVLKSLQLRNLGEGGFQIPVSLLEKIGSL